MSRECICGGQAAGQGGPQASCKTTVRVGRQRWGRSRGKTWCARHASACHGGHYAVYDVGSLGIAFSLS